MAIIDRCGMSGHDLLFPLDDPWANEDGNCNRHSHRHCNTALNEDRNRAINRHSDRTININRNRNSDAAFDIDRDRNATLDHGGVAGVNQPGVRKAVMAMVMMALLMMPGLGRARHGQKNCTCC
jgi:hypothetical protein